MIKQVKGGYPRCQIKIVEEDSDRNAISQIVMSRYIGYPASVMVMIQNARDKGVEKGKYLWRMGYPQYVAKLLKEVDLRGELQYVDDIYYESIDYYYFLYLTARKDGKIDAPPDWELEVLKKKQASYKSNPCRDSMTTFIPRMPSDKALHDLSIGKFTKLAEKRK